MKPIHGSRMFASPAYPATSMITVPMRSFQNSAFWLQLQPFPRQFLLREMLLRMDWPSNGFQGLPFCNLNQPILELCDFLRAYEQF